MADLGFPINFEGPLTEGQLELWSEEYRLDSERRAEEARIAETEARERGDKEAAARARCDGRRAETINLALIAADALGRAGVKGQVGVQDEYWLERPKLDEWREQRPTRIEKVKNWLTKLLFPKAHVPNDEIPRPTRPELFKGWLIEERVVEKQSGYVPYNEHFALILSDNVGGYRVPGFLAVARYKKDYDGTSHGATEQLRVKQNNIVHPVPDDIQRASMSNYRMDWPPSDATDLMMHMYSRAKCDSIIGSCSPWSFFTNRSGGFEEYETLGVEQAVQKAVRKFMIGHGLSPETVYGWGSRGRSDMHDVTPNGNTVAEQGVQD